MRNRLIAMAVGGMLTGLSHTASAQIIQRTGGGFAKSECFVSAGSCGGIAPATCPGPDCNTFVSGNGTNFVGVYGESRISMSGANISVSGSASFTPPSSCSPGQEGHPTYTSDGNQSIYADVPNKTPIRITITASLSGSGGGGASWSDAKSGIGGISTTTVFNALAGPGKITVDGVDYYLIDSIRANGIATSRRICSANRQSFSGSVSLEFEVLGTNLSKVSGGGSGPVGTRLANPLRVRVVDTATKKSVKAVNIDFRPVGACLGFSANPNFTATNEYGIASANVSLPQQTGSCVYEATCASCLGKRQVSFDVQATPRPELDLSGGDSGDNRPGGGPSPTGGSGGGRGGGGGGDDPLLIAYGQLGRFAFTRPPDGGYVGVLTGDQGQFRATPSDGTLEWSLDGLPSANGADASFSFGQERLIDNPSIVSVRRVEDDVTEIVQVLVETRPTGSGTKVVGATIYAELCVFGSDAKKCKDFSDSKLRAYAWAEAHFEPAGRSLADEERGSCHNNCCDAGVHSIWHAAMTKLVGLSVSQRISIAHEVDAVNGKHNEIVMDLHNNRLGQAVGVSTAGNDYEAIGADVLPRLRAGQALVFYNPYNNGKSPLYLSLLEKSFRCASQ